MHYKKYCFLRIQHILIMAKLNTNKVTAKQKMKIKKNTAAVKVILAMHKENLPVNKICSNKKK